MLIHLFCDILWIHTLIVDVVINNTKRVHLEKILAKYIIILLSA